MRLFRPRISGNEKRVDAPTRRPWLCSKVSDFIENFRSEADLVAVALALGASRTSLQPQERALAAKATGKPSAEVLKRATALIKAGKDPLGDAFCALRSAETRRENGATYTPAPIVKRMVEWASGVRIPTRVVDPGVGSGRFLLAAGAAFPHAELVGIDIDPLATLLARANLAAAGMSDRSRVVLGDYRCFDEKTAGATLYIGNPPYVRHHQIATKWKDWLAVEAEKLGFTASKLAGLHVHFFLATARKGKSKDFGAFITASEWLDVNYGGLVRSLVLKDLGGQSITVIDPTAQPFPDAATTAAITTFEIGAKPTSVTFRRVDALKNLGELGKGGRKVGRDRLAAQSRWSHLTRSSEKVPEGFVELGEICRVHRGQVTGANDVWIAGEHSEGLPASVLFRSVTRARDVLDADGILTAQTKLRHVIDLPADLDEIANIVERDAVSKFIRKARDMGANKGYIARHRKAWWSVGLRAPAPIIATYMARRPPAFVINKADARHINIAHGLYPREPLTATAQKTLVAYLSVNISQRSGRTYAGGLTKFEPREMERLIVPGPAMLAAGVTQ